ncbi:MAG: hypothetical protein HQK49_18345 [Oligoflexia bacterium]|nr:hypothetical protein [Oligoflexia bacterium]
MKTLSNNLLVLSEKDLYEVSGGRGQSKPNTSKSTNSRPTFEPKPRPHFDRNDRPINKPAGGGSGFNHHNSIPKIG